MADRKYKILIAEDDPDIVQLISLYLKSENYEILTADNGADAFELVKKEKPDLGIYDIMMPKMNGYELLTKTREIMNIPVIILSARTADSEKILGLDLGADDYIPKPFNPLELTARVRSALRRFYDLNPASQDDGRESGILRKGDLQIDTNSFSVKKGERELSLTSTELKILILLMQHPGRVYTKRQILENVSENYLDTDVNSLRVHISNIRDKIGKDAEGHDYIQTVRGLGYKFLKNTGDHS